MGDYLSYRRNRAYSNLGTFPDENYAREIMQLFSIGLVQLELDGDKWATLRRGVGRRQLSNHQIISNTESNEAQQAKCTGSWRNDEVPVTRVEIQ